MLIWLLACVQTIESNNREWIKEVLYKDNWRYLQRSPEALQQKFHTMSESEYAFMRGSLSVQLGHWSRNAMHRSATRFLNIADATMVPIFGDVHPENFTVSAHPTQPITAEIIDLDAAGFAPWTIDVRRALTAQRVFGAAMDGCDSNCQDAVVLGWLDGFQDCLQAEQCTRRDSVIVEDLIEEALEEGAEQKKYHKYTVDGQLDFDLSLNEEGKGIFPIVSGDRTPYQLFQQFAESRDETTRLLDVGQRFGMGISSRAALRYVFVWDTGLEGEEDNELLIAREVFDAPDYPGKLGLENAPFESNAHRVLRMRTMLWTNSDADPNYKGISSPFDFKTQSWSSYYQDAEVSKLQADWSDGKLEEGDVVDLAVVMGAHHASIWSNTTSLSDRNARAVILEDIEQGGGFDAFVAEMVTVSEADYRVHQEDYRWFNRELDLSGPLLGLDAMGEW